MATVTVTADNARWDAMDTNANVSSIGGGAGAVAEPDFVYQGTNSVSRKVSSSTGAGFYTDTGANRDITAIGRRTWLAKIIVTNSSAINASKLRLRVGSGTADYYEYDIADDGTAVGKYPPKDSWLIVPIDPNVSDHRNATVGAPALTAVAYFAIVSAFSSTSKGENVAMDSIDAGTGLYLVGGDGADTDGTFDDYVADDEGDITNGRFGYAHTKEGILYVYGRLAAGKTDTGTTTVTGFTDSDKTIVFPDGRFASGFSGLELDLGNASTDINWNNITFIGRGQALTNADTRPVLEVSGTLGAFDANSCTFTSFADFTLTSAATFLNSIFNQCVAMTLSTATLDSCTINGHDTATGIAFITTATLNNISDCTFDNTGGTGHAIELTTAGTYTFAGNTFTGYGADGTNDAAIYNNSGGAVTINITGGGETPTVRNGAGASTTINNSRTLTLTGILENSEVTIVRDSDSVELFHIENVSITGQVQYTYDAASAGTATTVLVFHISDAEPINFSLSLPSGDSSIPISQSDDRIFNNP